MKHTLRLLIWTFFLLAPMPWGKIIAQNATIAQQWNEAVLNAISRDFARPTVHARNLYHTSIAMYDAWAAYDPAQEPYLLGRTRGNYTSNFSGVAMPSTPEAVEEARSVAISFAAYRIIRHRFQNSPGAFLTILEINNRMTQLGLDRFNTSQDYINGGPAELGNYIAQQVINFGLTDGSNESADYANTFYTPLNGNILPEQPGISGVNDPNRWQAISLSVQIDQSGNAVSNPPHLSPEWGNVVPFSMTDANKTVKQRDGHNWNIYFDPGDPAYIDTTDASGLESFYKWNFCLVPIWQSHLDPDDDVFWDISPASFGNTAPEEYPTTIAEYHQFYNFFDGGAITHGYDLNPVTGQPYEPQFVKRGDYARILAEFWADGPQSVTPPGHWFKIYNGIRHHPLWVNKWNGQGEVLSALEYDVKTYLTLGGGMHDAAITAWGIKGYYDYVRPITAVRYMCSKGQCSDPNAPNYHPAGMPLIPGYVEQVQAGDPLAGANNEHVGKIKLYTWKGPAYIPNPETTYAGVGWILGENWWPYQRPTFVTPPFAGYISGHSTYSRTAAEILARTTGSPFFPGGMSNFIAHQNEFLEFEMGPSQTIALQWATYHDASDQTSLSRLWGGIHPPIDDVPGRKIGMELGPQVYNYATGLFETDRPIVLNVSSSSPVVNIASIGSTFTASVTFDREMNTNIAPAIVFLVNNPLGQAVTVNNVGWASNTTYQITYDVETSNLEMPDVFMRIQNAEDADGVRQNVFLQARPFRVDTKRPTLQSAMPSTPMANDAVAAGNGVQVTFNFSEACNTNALPELSIIGTAAMGVVTYNTDLSHWTSETQFVAVLSIADTNEEIQGIGVAISNVFDTAGNDMLPVEQPALFNIDTRNPAITAVVASNTLLNTSSVGSQALSITLTFDEPMNTGVAPQLLFPTDNPMAALVLNTFATGWADDQTHITVYNQVNSSIELNNIQVEIANYTDLAGNAPEEAALGTVFSIDTKRPQVEQLTPTGVVLADADLSDGAFHVDVTFGESMNNAQILVQLTGAPGISSSMTYNPFQSSWLNPSKYRAAFVTSDQNVEIPNVGINISAGFDLAGNGQLPFSQTTWVSVDTKNPQVNILLANTYDITAAQVGEGGFSILAIFSEAMSQEFSPTAIFNAAEDISAVLALNESLSGWVNSFTYQLFFDVANTDFIAPQVSVTIGNAFDVAGNLVVPTAYSAFFNININASSAGGSLSANGYAAYPNPITPGAPINILAPTTKHHVRLQLWSVDGKLVHEENLNTLAEGSNTIHMPGYVAEGVYFVLLSNQEMREGFKLVVQK
jgi:hypothetical protein